MMDVSYLNPFFNYEILKERKIFQPFKKKKKKIFLGKYSSFGINFSSWLWYSNFCRLPSSRLMFYHLVGQVWLVKWCKSLPFSATCLKDLYLSTRMIHPVAPCLSHTIQKSHDSSCLDSLALHVPSWHP